MTKIESLQTSPRRQKLGGLHVDIGRSSPPQPVAVPAADFHARHEGVLSVDVMKAARAVLFGDGSLGSLIAGFLVRAGIAVLDHFDNDSVEVTNLCRTLYGEAHLGLPKVEALDEILRGIRKDIVLNGHNGDINLIPDDELLGIIDQANLVIVATDHPPTQSRVAALSYWRKPSLIPGVYERGTGGEVVFTIPNQSACWHCVFNGIRTEEQPDRGTPDYGVATGQLKAVPALGVDIATVAVATAKLAIALLHLGTGSELERVLSPGRNILFLGNAIDWAFTDYNENFWARTTRRPDCPVCMPSNAP